MYGAYICTTNYLQAQGIVRPPAAAAAATALLHPFVNYTTIHLLGEAPFGQIVSMFLVLLMKCRDGTIEEGSKPPFLF
jgi:hypothetical protein